MVVAVVESMLRYMDVGFPFPNCPTAAWQMHSARCVVAAILRIRKSGIHSIKETSLRSTVNSSQKAIANKAH